MMKRNNNFVEEGGDDNHQEGCVVAQQSLPIASYEDQPLQVLDIEDDESNLNVRESIPNDFLSEAAVFIRSPPPEFQGPRKDRYTQPLEYSEDQLIALTGRLLQHPQHDYFDQPDDTVEQDHHIDEINNCEMTERTDVFIPPNEIFVEPVVLTEKSGCHSSNDKLPAQKPAASKKDSLYFYVYGGNYPETISDALMTRGNWQLCTNEQEAIEKCHFLWKPFNYAPEYYKRIDKRVSGSKHSSAPFIYNHFEVLKGLVTKSGLIRSLKSYYYNNEQARQAGYSIFDSTPTTFLLSSGCSEDSDWSDFQARYKDIQRGYAPKERIPIKHCVNNIWLVKPSNANQGRGIEIFSDLEEMQHFISTRPQFTCWVVQKYIERPLLFYGRKFDIRVWALFTCKNEVYMYRQGYLRTSSDVYNLSNGNNYVHLTNNCLQKYGSNYGQHEDGNTVGFHVLQAYLEEHFPQYHINVKDHFIPRMKDLIIDTFNASKLQLNPNRRKNCFELLGYDFLIDEDFRLWLIEVNTNPYFGVPNVFIAELLPKMIDDMLDLVVDPVYPPNVKPERVSSERPNDFELLYCENTSGSVLVNQRRAFNTSMYPISELAQQVGPKAARQDMKYLRQFKVMNLNLSTWSFKNQKQQQQPNLSIQQLAKRKQQDQSQDNRKLVSRSKSVVAIMNHHHSPQKKTAQQVSAIDTRQNSSNSKPRIATSVAAPNKKLSQKSKGGDNTTVAKTADFIKLRKFLNKSQCSTPKMGVEGSPKMDEETIEEQQHPVAIVKQDDSSKTECSNSSFALKSQGMKASQMETVNNAPRQDHSFDMFSNRSSSQEKFAISRRTREKSYERGIAAHKNQPDGFEFRFQKYMDLINNDKNEDLKVQEHLNALQTLIERNQNEMMSHDKYLIDIMALAVQTHQSLSISYTLLPIIEQYKEKLQFKHYLSRNLALQRQTLNFYSQLTDPHLKHKILSILQSMSCVEDVSKIQATLQNNSAKKERERSESRGQIGRTGSSLSRIQVFDRVNKPAYNGTPQTSEHSSLIRSGIFRKCMQNGIILFLFKESKESLLRYLTQEEKFELMNRLRFYSESADTPYQDDKTKGNDTTITIEHYTGDTPQKNLQAFSNNDINIIDLSREDKPIEVYNPQYASKYDKLFNMVKSEISPEMSSKLIQMIQDSMPSLYPPPRPQLEAALNNSRMSFKSQDPGRRTRKQRDSSVCKKGVSSTIDIQQSLTSPQQNGAYNLAYKSVKGVANKDYTPDVNQSYNGRNSQIRPSAQKSPFTTAIKLRPSSPQKTSKKDERGVAPSPNKKDGSPPQASRGAPQFIKQHTSKVKQPSRASNVQQRSKHPSQQQQHQVTTIGSEKSKFKPVLKSKTTLNSTPYAQASINTSAAYTRKQQAPTKSTIGLKKQTYSMLNQDLAEQFKHQKVKNNRSSIQYQKVQLASEVLGQQSVVEYRQQSNMGNLQRAVMENSEDNHHYHNKLSQKLNDIQDNLTILQSRQQKMIISPKHFANEDGKEIFLPFKKKVANESSDKAVYRESIKMQQDAADANEDRIKLFSTIQDSREKQPITSIKNQLQQQHQQPVYHLNSVKNTRPVLFAETLLEDRPLIGGGNRYQRQQYIDLV